MLAVVGPLAHAAGSLGDYRLLVLHGTLAKWGSPALGTGADLTYATATAPLHTAGAINCGDIIPMDSLLAASHVRRADFDAQMDAAFAAWAGVADVTFTRIANPADADIVIGAEGVPGDRAFTNVATSGTTAIRATSATSGAAAISGSLICLNPEQAWKIGFDGNLSVYDLRYTLLHEIGHAIGLDHPDSPNAVMNYHYTEAFSSLQAGDIAGAVALYGPRPFIAATAAPARPAATPAAIKP